MTDPQHDAAPASSSPHLRWLGAGAAVLASLALVLGLSGLFAQGGEPGVAPPSSSGAPSNQASPASPTSSATASEGAAGEASPRVRASAPQRLIVESAGIDVAVVPLTPTAEDQASQSLVPPFTLDGYWLTTYGKPGLGSRDTTYITGHSWEDREAPFNLLSTATEVGDEVLLHTQTGEQRFVVDSITTYDKDTLKDSEIWEIVPNRLVLISCYTEDPLGKNVVVTAVPKR